jgi:hypothetical protein
MVAVGVSLIIMGRAAERVQESVLPPGVVLRQRGRRGMELRRRLRGATYTETLAMRRQSSVLKSDFPDSAHY